MARPLRCTQGLEPRLGKGQRTPADRPGRQSMGNVPETAGAMTEPFQGSLVHLCLDAEPFSSAAKSPAWVTTAGLDSAAATGAAATSSPLQFPVKHTS